MCDEALPSGIFPLRAFQSVPDRQQQEAQEHQRLPLAESVTEIAELNQPGIGDRADRRIEGTDKPSQRHIPVKQPYENKDERNEGADKRHEATKLSRDVMRDG